MTVNHSLLINALYVYSFSGRNSLREHHAATVSKIEDLQETAQDFAEQRRSNLRRCSSSVVLLSRNFSLRLFRTTVESGLGKHEVGKK